jgi:hypothetical protein
MTVGARRNFLSVLRPEIPEHQVRSLRCRKVGKSVDAAVLPNPVSRMYMVGVRLLCETCSDGLFGCEEALLRLRYLAKPSGGLFVRSRHCTYPRLSRGSMHCSI